MTKKNFLLPDTRQDTPNSGFLGWRHCLRLLAIWMISLAVQETIYAAGNSCHDWARARALAHSLGFLNNKVRV
ncbi:MAG: hypothetical protein PHR16_13215 [Methylovulum sp.]|nr:hypothetical protein [Methylovulum sp.]